MHDVKEAASIRNGTTFPKSGIQYGTIGGFFPEPFLRKVLAESIAIEMYVKANSKETPVKTKTGQLCVETTQDLRLEIIMVYLCFCMLC